MVSSSLLRFARVALRKSGNHAGLIGVATALACPLTSGQVFTCTDATGKTFLSDKRIPECIDRVQKELGTSGVVKRQIAPETHQSRLASQVAASNESVNEKTVREARQQRALMDRYPDEASHNLERKRALATVDEGIAYLTNQNNTQTALNKRLLSEQAALKAKNEVTPAALQQQINENQSLLELLKQQLQERQQERRRINQRYDGELYLLRQAWEQAGVPRR